MPSILPASLFSLTDDFIARATSAGHASENALAPAAAALPPIAEDEAAHTPAEGSSGPQEGAASTSEAAQKDAGTTCLTCGIGATCLCWAGPTDVLACMSTAEGGLSHAGSTSPAFKTVAEQRAHFRSDWHRCNVRRKVHARAAMSEAEFERSVQGDADELSSISGSGSDDDSAEELAARQGSHASAGALQRSSQIIFLSGQPAHADGPQTLSVARHACHFC